MPEGASTTPTVKPPALTEAEKVARAARLREDHEAFLKSIATMRNLPRLRSTIAGAGGKTNEQARIAEEIEAGRLARLRASAAAAAAAQDAKDAHDAKLEKLAARQAKKKRKRDRKHQARARRQRTEAEASSLEDASSSDESDATA